MTNAIQKIKAWDKKYWANKSDFKKEIKHLNTTFEFNGKNGFEIFPPTFFIGNIDSKKLKYIFVGLNPGYNKESNYKEEKWRNTHRKNALDDCKNLFVYFAQSRWPKYFTFIHNIVEGKKFKNKNEKIDYYTGNRERGIEATAVNIDAFPFHSSKYKIALQKMSTEQLKKFFYFWNISKSLIKKVSGKYIIIFGKQNYILFLLDKEFGITKLKLEKAIKKDNGGRVHIYKFKFGRKTAFLIDEFLGGGQNRLTKNDRDRISNYLRSMLR